MIRLLAMFVLTLSVAHQGFASNPSAAELVATYDLSQLPVGNKTSSAVSMAFLSETSIAIVLCPNAPDGCSISLLRRDETGLRRYASALHLRRARAIYASNNGQILITPFAGSPATLLSPDLSTAQDLPRIFLASQSGNTGAEFMKGGWKLYRINSKPELVREGKGSLRSLSDEAVVFQDGNFMRVESLSGDRLGSFPMKPEAKCYNQAHLLSTNKLYLADCKKTRVVDFDGKQRAELRPPPGWRADQSWSRNGERILFHNFDRKISILRNAGEIALAIGSLGMGVADEQDNREEVMVLDATTGNSCFDWKRSFPEGTTVLERDAAISPSGEFVAIAASGTLSLYHLPQACTGVR